MSAIPEELMREANEMVARLNDVSDRDAQIVVVLAALRARDERAARIVRENQECTSLKTNKRYLVERSDGNLVGLAYATAILSDKEQSHAE